ncbi:MAG: amidohydrolase family protein [Proteobacteria bacterium]|nr:amidohydrolase family protein [Pseudomonadota bacterium]
MAAGPARAAQSDADTAYVGASILDADGSRFIRDATLLVHGTTIAAIGPTSSTPLPPGTRCVKLDGRFIIPGLVNTHVHLATRADPRQARAYLRRELFSGVTMVRDMAGDVRLIAELKREAAEHEFPSPDIYYAALMAGATFFTDPRTHDASYGLEPGTAPWMQAITPTTDIRLAIARARGTGATGIKLYADLPAQVVEALTEEAHRQGLLVWAHAAVFPAKPSDVIRAGVDVISHADFLAFETLPSFPQTFAEARSADLRHWQTAPALNAVLAEMKRRGTILDATVDVGYRSSTPKWPAALASQLTHEAYLQGIPVSAGTDDDADWKYADSALLDEIERLVHDVGMTSADALRSATTIGARTIGKQDLAGVLMAGRLANFVVLRADALKDIRNLRRIDRVVKDGIEYRRSAYRPVTPSGMARRPL